MSHKDKDCLTNILNAELNKFSIWFRANRLSLNLKKTKFIQGHPMDLFLKISVLHANFCWLGDVEEIIVLGRKVLLGKR